jgi:hypothetical protein
MSNAGSQTGDCNQLLLLDYPPLRLMKFIQRIRGTVPCGFRVFNVSPNRLAVIDNQACRFLFGRILIIYHAILQHVIPFNLY